MRTLDETDFHILRLLLEDSRRPYSEIAEKVGVSSPTVSERVDRMREIGVIKGFTLELDRTLLDEGVPVLVDLRVKSNAIDEVKRSLESFESVENIFTTADSHVLFKAVSRQSDIPHLISETTEDENIHDYDVKLLTSSSSQAPNLGNAELAIKCAECGNTVTTEGESTRIDGKLYHFCCTSCESEFKERYDRFKTEAVES
ncbi:MAG: AsnC family transcriptional regulator [Halobacteria archaeon]|nr:AsnC family transcriptional regulator [Halobacteria archaeon]